MLKILLAIIIFGVIVFIHELGHFIAAKIMKIKVLAFAIGMGPKIIKKSIGETEYSLRLLPIGGFCSMEGEQVDIDAGEDVGDRPVGVKSLNNRPIWQRFILYFAGPFMNIVLGFIIAVILTCMMNAVPSTQIGGFNSEIIKESELQVGDEIIKVNGMKIFTPSELSYQAASSESENYDVTVNRDGKKIELKNVKLFDKIEGKFVFGIDGLDKTLLNVLSYSVKDTISTARLIWISLGDLISGKYGLKDMSGPIGIVNEIGNAASSGKNIKQSAMSLMSLSMFLSINLGIVNLLPIPGLDGGHILLLIIEAIRRKPLKPNHEVYVNLIGLGLIMLLIVVITFSDIMKLFG